MIGSRIAIFLLALFCTISFAKIDVDVGGDIIAGWSWDSREIYPNNEFYLDRVRPKIEVDFDTLDRFSAEISFDLNFYGAELKDVELDYKYSRAIGFGIGRRRKPFGVEDLFRRWSSPGVDWTELHGSLDDAHYLDRDVGLWAKGKVFQEPYQIEYEIGIFNGRDDEVITSEKNYAGRLIYSPSKSIDLIFSYGNGLDTLGLKFRDGIGVGAILEFGDLDCAGEAIFVQDMDRGKAITGYQVWVRYFVGNFAPYIQFEALEDLWNNPDDPDCSIDNRQKRFHLGLTFDPVYNIRLRLESIHDNIETEPQYTTIKLQAQVDF